MAMYLTPSSKRLPWDVDGTVLLFMNQNRVLAEATVTQRKFLNGENAIAEHSDEIFFGLGYYGSSVSGGVGSSPISFVFVFPHPVSIAYMKFWFTSLSFVSDVFTQTTEYSTDSSNGIDGSWSEFSQTGIKDMVPSTASWTVGFDPSVVPNYRIPESNVASNVKAIRINLAGDSSPGSNYPDLGTAHIYGDYESGVNPDRLEVWHPSSDAEVAPGFFDWTDIARSSTAQKTFRVKNRSSSLTANSVVLSLEENASMTPPQVGWHELSSDGSTWSSSLNIGNLAPGAISSVLYLRRVTPANAQLSLGALRLAATAGSWS